MDVGTLAVAVAERDALGTDARVAVWPAEGLAKALSAVDAELGQLDRQASRFRGDSEISRIQRSQDRAHRVSRGLAEALRVALAAARWTRGMVDPTVGGALNALGYDRDFASIDADSWPGAGCRPPGARAWLAAGRTGRDPAAAARRASASTSVPPPRGWAPTARRRRRGAPADAAASWSAWAATSPSPASRRRRLAGRGRGLIPARTAAARRGQVDQAGRRGRGRDVIGHLPPVAARRAPAAPHRRPAHRVPGYRAVADRVRCRAELRRGQRRRHRGDRRRARSASLAGRDPAAGAARQP